MNYAEGSERLAGLRARIAELRQEMRAVQDELTPQPVDDHDFAGPDGPLRLSQLFGDKDDLFVIHNMGAGCRYCTLWADGYNGIYPHLASRAGFVVTSPDAPEVQKTFAASRGWRFPMASHLGSSFAQDLGYRSAGGGWLPGISVFRREGERILRVSDSSSNPGDDFCALWHFFDLLPEGAGEWRPRFGYACRSLPE